MTDRSVHDDSGRLPAEPAQGIDGEDWLTVSQVAAGVHVSRDTVERWIHTGLVRAVDVSCGNSGLRRRPCWRVSSASIESFLEGRMNLPPMPQARHRRQSKKPGIVEFIK